MEPVSATSRKIASARPGFSNIPAVLADIEEVLRSGRLMLGEKLRLFEERFAELAGTAHAVGLTSCTSALEITLRYLKLEGGEVVLPTNTFIATLAAVLYGGGKPVLADVDPHTLMPSADSLVKTITPRTRAVILVHLAGLISPEMSEIRKLCLDKKLALIEDCAHAHGASFAGEPAGSMGLAGCFSFYPTKIMTTGTGGMLTTNDTKLRDFARSLRVHGREEGTANSGEQITELGNDWFLDEIRSVLGLHQLADLPASLERRRAVARLYRQLLRDIPAASPVEADSRCEPAWYKFMVLFDPTVDTVRLRAALRENHGIETEQLYSPPCHLQPVYRRLFGGKEGDFPGAEAALRQQICLPIHSSLTDDEARSVVAALKEELERGGRP